MLHICGGQRTREVEIHNEASEESRRIIPILLPGADDIGVPEQVAMRTWVDESRRRGQWREVHRECNQENHSV
jgi:hypothetical protein